MIGSLIRTWTCESIIESIVSGISSNVKARPCIIMHNELITIQYENAGFTHLITHIKIEDYSSAIVLQFNKELPTALSDPDAWKSRFWPINEMTIIE